MDSPTVNTTHEHGEVSRLAWTNETDGRFRFDPSEIVVTFKTTVWLHDYPTLTEIKIELPSTWVTDRPVIVPVDPSVSEYSWEVSPRETPPGFEVPIRVIGLEQGRALVSQEQCLSIEIRGVSQFRPTEHGIQTANSTDGWGVVAPHRDVFNRTYGFSLFPNRFFNGLYRKIVFLGGQLSGYQGGICTGMARVALERSLSSHSTQPTLDDILLWHGRQLCDRALLAASPWLFRPSPRRAFLTLRRELERDGKVTRCFDIGVPKPWRKDVFSALEKEGHTVVPYAFTQTSDKAATVSVYDPNFPDASELGERVMLFDLDRDSYEYSGIATLDDHQTTIIAVGQGAYRNARGAVLASLASLVLDGSDVARKLVMSGLARLKSGIAARAWSD